VSHQIHHPFRISHTPPLIHSFAASSNILMAIRDRDIVVLMSRVMSERTKILRASKSLYAEFENFLFTNVKNGGIWLKIVFLEYVRNRKNGGSGVHHTKRVHRLVSWIQLTQFNRDW
jgi:hypothetical protein